MTQNGSQHWLITGGTGLIGSAVVRNRLTRGDRITILTRSKEKAEKLFSSSVRAITSLDEIQDDEKIDLVLNLAGESLAGGFWTKRRKEAFFTSRIGTATAINNLLSRLKSKPACVISGSAIGYYGNQPECVFSERDEAGDDFLASICTKWEAEAEKGSQHSGRLILLRTGLVLASDHGLLPPLAETAKLGLATILGDGKHIMSWISLVDMVRLINFLADRKDLSGPINATAPEPVSQKKFQKALSKCLKRPQFMWFPAWALRFFLRDMADLFLTGQYVIPQRALRHGFTFTHTDLASALNYTLNLQD